MLELKWHIKFKNRLVDVSSIDSSNDSLLCFSRDVTGRCDSETLTNFPVNSFQKLDLLGSRQ